MPFPPDLGGRLRPSDVIGSFFVAGLAMMAAALVVVVGDAVGVWSTGRWLPLHLVFVGGVSQLILGASQFFSGAFLATDPPPKALIRAQLLAWNVGTIALAVGMQTRTDAVTIAAAALLVATLLAYAGALLLMQRRSLSAAPWAVRWYLAGALLFIAGIAAGADLAAGGVALGGDLLAAHMVLNVGGWFGLAIVGTLHTFFPSLTHSRLRFPRLQAPTFAGWVAGILALACGYGFDVPALAVAGWFALLVAASLLVANMVGSLLATEREVSLAARIVAAGQVALVAGLALAAAVAVVSGPESVYSGATRPALATLIVAGWVGLTVIGSLLHLLPLLLRVRDLRRGMPIPRPGRDAGLVAWAVAGVGALAFTQALDGGTAVTVARVLLGSVYLVLLAKVARLTVELVRTAPPRI